MIYPEDRHNTQLVDGIESTLRDLPDVAVHSRTLESSSIGRVFDAVFQIEAAGKANTLLVETKKNVFPRDVRQLMWDINQVITASTQSAPSSRKVPVIAADSISQGAKELLRAEHVGYYETNGSLYLPCDGLYVLLEKPPSKAASKRGRALFTGRRSQVVHALLRKPNQWLAVKHLAQEAQVSTATASQVLTELEKHEILSSRGSGPSKQRILAEPRRLLDMWSKQVSALSRPLIRRFYVPSLKGEELLARIDKICANRNVIYAITGEWAAQIYSPFLSSISQVRCRIPADQSIGEIVSELNAREVQEGSNLGITETKSYGDFLFRQKERNVWLASPILVYLDLLQGEGRAAEMADHLRRERIGF